MQGYYHAATSARVTLLMANSKEAAETARAALMNDDSFRAAYLAVVPDPKLATVKRTMKTDELRLNVKKIRPKTNLPIFGWGCVWTATGTAFAGSRNPRMALSCASTQAHMGSVG
jgi:hypothetical protein